jgi:DNA-binding transcriptional regulator LsrR (DeoR family)
VAHRRRDRAELAEVARLYYVDERSQDEIASLIGTGRSNVSRMLRAAREQRVITFHVHHPLARQRELEDALQEATPLTEAVVLSAEAGEESLSRVGELAARWLEDHLKDGQRLAISWGRSLQATVDQAHPEHGVDVDVVQLGGDLQVHPEMSGHELVRGLAARFGGTHSYLHAPAILDSSATARRLTEDPTIGEQLARARTADVAAVGVGAPGRGTSAAILEQARLSAEERAAFEATGAVGDVCARFFDAGGREVESPLRHRVLAIELDELAAIPTVVGIAAGSEKATAARGALRGGLLDVLVCDQAVARGALRAERGR